MAKPEKVKEIERYMLFVLPNLSGLRAWLLSQAIKRFLNKIVRQVSSLGKEEGPVKITVLKRFDTKEVFKDLPVRAKYSGPCPDFKEGQVFCVDSSMPTGFCSYAWDVIFPYVKALKSGDNFSEWYEDSGVVVACCPDGLRPAVFKLERK